MTTSSFTRSIVIDKNAEGVKSLMDDLNREDRIVDLSIDLSKYKTAYYNGSPLVSDADFDTLEDELRQLDPNNKYFKLVGATSLGDNKRKHTIPMGSQAKVKIEDDGIQKVIDNFINKKTCVVSHKLDGISFTSTYENGKFKHATTRGDGFVGEDIPHATQFINVFEEVYEISSGGYDYSNFTVRGELVMSYKDFEKINAELSDDDKFSNPRNAVAGIVRKADSPYHQYIVALYYYFDDGTEIETKTEMFGHLVTVFAIGMTALYTLEVDEHEFRDLAIKLDKERKELPYMIDGLVIEFDDLEYAKSLGVANGNKPKGSIAFKFSAVAETTNVTDVVWQVSNLNLTPIVEFEPVLIDGSIVRRASIHNYDIFQEWGFRKGDEILVQKNNDIIPQVKDLVGTHPDNEEIDEPEYCPVCGHKLYLIKVAKTTNLVCTNVLCQAKFVGAIKKWCTKSGMTTKGVGDAFFESFAENDGMIENIYDLTVEDIMELSDRYKTKSATKIHDAIQSSKTMKLMDFFGGLNIFGAGSRTFKKLIDASGAENVDELFFYIDNTNLSNITGIGPTTSTYIKEGVNTLYPLILHLRDIIGIEDVEEVSADAHTYLFTGSFNTEDPSTGKGYKRKALEALVTSKGHKPASSVNKYLNYLVTSDPDSSSSKMVKARKLGVTILGEDEFFGMME